MDRGEFPSQIASDEVEEVQHLHDRILAKLRSRGVACDSDGLNLEKRRAFMSVNCIEAGRLRCYDKIEALFFRQRFRAVLARLFAHQAREPDFMVERRQLLAHLAKRPQHGGHRPLGIACAAAPDFSIAKVAAKWVDRHALHAHGVRVRREEHAGLSSGRARPACDHIWAVWQDFAQLDFRANAFQKSGQPLSDLLFADTASSRLAMRIHAGNSHERLEKLYGGGRRVHTRVESTTLWTGF